MRRLLFLALLTLVACFTDCLRAQTAITADSGHFTINEGNHPVGRSDFSIQPIQQGSIATPAAYLVNSHGTLTLKDTSYSFSGSGSLDSSLGILQEDLNGIVNGSAVTFSVRTSESKFAVNISANGKSYQNSLNRSGQTVFFPDFDLASYEILLSLAANHAGAVNWALIPKQTGILSAASLAPQADVQATLNSKPLTAHHQSLTIGSVTSELYYSGANRILEVDIPSQAFAIVHDNFQLQAPPPPPPQTAPSGQQPDAGQPPSQPQ
jgi:hypothetical protein